MNDRHRTKKRAFNKWTWPAFKKKFIKVLYAETAKRLERAILYGVEKDEDIRDQME